MTFVLSIAVYCSTLLAILAVYGFNIQYETESEKQVTFNLSHFSLCRAAQSYIIAC